MALLFFSILASQIRQYDVRVVRIPADYWRSQHLTASTRSPFRNHDGPPIELSPTLGGRISRNRYRLIWRSDIEPINRKL